MSNFSNLHITVSSPLIPVLFVWASLFGVVQLTILNRADLLQSVDSMEIIWFQRLVILAALELD